MRITLKFSKLYGRSWNHLSPENNTQLLHQKYIASLQREKKWVRFYQFFIFLLFFSIWELASRRNWIDPLLFSSPSKIWNLLINKLQDGTLIANISVTLTETVFGFILGTL